MKYFVVCYSGTFAFMKPPSATRNKYTKSDTFLSPSTQEGIRRKLGVSNILRHRLQCFGVRDIQEEAKAPNYGQPDLPQIKRKKEKGVQKNGVLLYPKLFLALPSEQDALCASENHILLSRQEYILLPERIDGKFVVEMTDKEFDSIEGWEFFSTGNSLDMFVGVDRYTNEKSLGIVEVYGDPLGHLPTEKQRFV